MKYTALALLSVLVAVPVEAAEIRHIAVDDDTGFITIIGQLESGDEQKFNVAAQGYSRGAVLLESEGGSMWAAIQIGELIRLKGFGTGVAPGTMCASACALIWLGGSPRILSSSAKIGFHAAFYVDNGIALESGQANALVGAYMTRIGLPRSAVMYVTEAAPHEIKWLTPTDARQFGIDLQVQEIWPDQMGPSAPAERLSAGNNYHYVTGLPKREAWLAFRAGPSADSGLLDKLPADTILKVLEEQGAWFRVRLWDGREGWVAARYVACCKTAGNELPTSGELTLKSLATL